jgi:polyhydroxybutyrate depolymerase
MVGALVVGALVAAAVPALLDAVPAAAAGGAEPSSGCRAAPPAASTENPFDAAGESGFYFQSVPPGARPGRPLPLVVDLHGYSETAALQEDFSQLAVYGDQRGFVTITPQINRPVPLWSDTLASPDVRFLGALLDQAERTLCIDERRVYLTGLSDGAFMTSAVACAFADRVAAVAPVSGIQDIAGCKPARPVPVVTFHGTADPFVSYTGGLGPSALHLPAPNGTGTLGQSGATPTTGPSIPAITAAWARRNGCAPGPSSTVVASGVTLIRYRCPNQADVELYRITGGGHTWPGSQFGRQIASAVGFTTTAISANQIIWRFFEAHPLR